MDILRIYEGFNIARDLVDNDELDEIITEFEREHKLGDYCPKLIKKKKIESAELHRNQISIIARTHLHKCPKCETRNKKYKFWDLENHMRNAHGLEVDSKSDITDRYIKIFGR